MGRINGINEPSCYKLPEKLPAILYFKKGEMKEFEETLECLRKDKDAKEVI